MNDFIHDGSFENIMAPVEKDDEIALRENLESQFGEVWTTEQARELFEFVGFIAPHAVVRRKRDNQLGSVEFTHMPRFYFDFVPHEGCTLPE